jgi:hypothetical protein
MKLTGYMRLCVHIIKKFRYHLTTTLILGALVIETKVFPVAKSPPRLKFSASSEPPLQDLFCTTPPITTDINHVCTHRWPPTKRNVRVIALRHVPLPFFCSPLTSSQSLRPQPRRADQSPATQRSLNRAILRVWRDH